MVKERAKAKFDETIEIAMNLGVDPRHADQMVRGVVNLPNGSGRSVRVGVFARGAKADEAKAAGADVVGAEDLVEKVNARQHRLRPLHRHAGPDAARRPARQGAGPARPDAQPEGRHRDDGRRQRREGRQGRLGRIPGRVAGIVHAGVGKASFAAEKLVENIKAFADAVNKAKPSGAKGNFINRIAISSTMGPGVKVDMSTLGMAGGGSGQQH